MKLVVLKDGQTTDGTGARPRRRRSFLNQAVTSLKCICGGGLVAACGAEPGSDGSPDGMVRLPPITEGNLELKVDEYPELQKVGGSIKGMAEGVGPLLIVREEEGKVAAASAMCTHMACPLRYNSLNLTYDCLCHGSTFELDGQVINGPATEPVPTYAVEFDGKVARLKMR